MEIKKGHLESDMIRYQDRIEKLREEDEEELSYLKETLKNLKSNSEDMDYDLIRLGKARDRKKKKLRYDVEDMELNIYNIKRTEGDKKTEIKQAKMELQKAQDKWDVQKKKLEEDLKFYEIECKKARFVFENYEREVKRWRKEVEEQETIDQDSNFLSVPNKNHRRSGMSSSRSRSRSRSRSKSKNKEKPQPFQRISKRSLNHGKENNSIQINIENTEDSKSKSKTRKSLKPRARQALKKVDTNKQKLKIKNSKSGKRRRV